MHHTSWVVFTLMSCISLMVVIRLTYAELIYPERTRFSVSAYYFCLTANTLIAGICAWQVFRPILF